MNKQNQIVMIVVVLLSSGIFLSPIEDEITPEESTIILFEFPKLVSRSSTVFEIEEVNKTIEIVSEESTQDLISVYILELSKTYGVDANLIHSIVWHESRYDPLASTGYCFGLMQVCSKWHKERMSRLNVTDIFDPYQNLLVGIDYISELQIKYKDIGLVLMLYNMKHKSAWALYKQGKLNWYATSVLKRAARLNKEGG